MWFWKVVVEHWVSFLPVGLITLLGAGGIAYTMFRKPKDRGFLANTSGQQLRWQPSVKLVVWVHPALPLAYIAALKRVADTYQGVIGRLVLYPPMVAPVELRFDQPFPVNSIGVVSDSGIDPNHGQTILYDHAGALQYAIMTLPEANIEDAYSIVLHEMGHVLGLAHDDSPTSIMYPKIHARPQMLSAADAKLLHDYYG